MSDCSNSSASPNRWAQLIMVIICMVMITTLQYGWTLFVRPMNQPHGWVVADIQIAFGIFIAIETQFTPVVGWLADKIGAKFVIASGGAVYAISVGSAVKWFSDRRGLAMGLAAAGAGAALTVIPIRTRGVLAE